MKAEQEIINRLYLCDIYVTFKISDWPFGVTEKMMKYSQCLLYAETPEVAEIKANRYMEQCRAMAISIGKIKEIKFGLMPCK